MRLLSRHPGESSPAEDPEMELLLRCARLDQDDSRLSARALLSDRPVLDWNRFLAAADRNGMTPLVSNVLASHAAELVPETIRDLLREYYRANELRSRLLTDELLRLLDALEGDGIEALPFKGPLMASWAYGHAALREFVDLDIVVRLGDVPRARERLRALGYRRRMEARGPRHEEAYVRTWNEDEWVSADDLVYLDLHWRLVPRRLPFRLETDLLWRCLETNRLAGRPVRTLSLEGLLVCLCAHGTKDRWRRLIWLCDIDRILSAHGPPDWQALQAFAATARCQRALAVGLYLARVLVGSPGSDSPRTNVPDPGLLALLHYFRGGIADGEPAPSFLQEWLDLRGCHLRSLDGFGDRVRYVLRTVLTPNKWDWARFHLPDAAYPLYYLLRPLRLAGRGGRLLGRRL